MDNNTSIIEAVNSLFDDDENLDSGEIVTGGLDTSQITVINITNNDWLEEEEVNGNFLLDEWKNN